MDGFNSSFQSSFFCHTGHALNYTLQNIFQPNVGMRADSENIVVLITDGQSTDDVDSPSQELKDAGIEVYVVGE